MMFGSNRLLDLEVPDTIDYFCILSAVTFNMALMLCCWEIFIYCYYKGNNRYKLDIQFYPELCPKLTVIQPTWSAYPYHLVFLIWYPYSLVFLIWYPYALTSLYGNTAHCSGYGVAMGCYGLFIVRRTAIVTSQ